VRTVDGVQGLEFRTLIISTVRTCSVLGDNEEDAGFLSNPKVCSYLVSCYYETSLSSAKAPTMYIIARFTHIHLYPCINIISLIP